jgi:hypothetical protein
VRVHLTFQQLLSQLTEISLPLFLPILAQF